jgi:hypothetical protein
MSGKGSASFAAVKRNGPLKQRPDQHGGGLETVGGWRLISRATEE